MTAGASTAIRRRIANAAASPPIAMPRCAASRAIARWQVTMSARPSAIPVGGRPPSRTSVAEGEQLPLERLVDRVEDDPPAGLVRPVEIVRIVGSWSRYGAGNASSTDPPTKWNRTSSRYAGSPGRKCQPIESRRLAGGPPEQDDRAGIARRPRPRRPRGRSRPRRRRRRG